MGIHHWWHLWTSIVFTRLFSKLARLRGVVCLTGRVAANYWERCECRHTNRPRECNTDWIVTTKPLTHCGLVTQVFVNMHWVREFVGTCVLTNHNLSQCWRILYWNTGTTFQSKYSRNFPRKIILKNGAWKLLATYNTKQCVHMILHTIRPWSSISQITFV